VTDLRAVVFDWRGTLVTTLAAEEWVGEALALLGRERDAESVAHLLTERDELYGVTPMADLIYDSVRWTA
jgi:phosphoglycolate phosphatase-like HAD superfamily hydrolase